MHDYAGQKKCPLCIGSKSHTCGMKFADIRRSTQDPDRGRSALIADDPNQAVWETCEVRTNSPSHAKGPLSHTKERFCPCADCQQDKEPRWIEHGTYRDKYVMWLHHQSCLNLLAKDSYYANHRLYEGLIDEFCRTPSLEDIRSRLYQDVGLFPKVIILSLIHI